MGLEQGDWVGWKAWAVLALKARAALYAASPLFNPTDNKELWYRAAKANKEILDDSNGFAEKAKLLVDDYSSLWSKDSYNDATSELIFLRRATTTTNSFEGYNFPVGLENCKVKVATVPHRHW